MELGDPSFLIFWVKPCCFYPFYAVILDKDFNQLGTDIPFPSTSNFPNVVNKDGELVVSKIAGLSETEDEGVILYKLKLKVE